MTIAQVERLTVSPGRREQPALIDVDLEISAGETILLTGASGSGKSTLLRALAGLIPHFHGGRMAGRVTIMGHDTRLTPPATLAHWVGTVFQDPETQGVGATVERDIAFGLEHHAVAPGEIRRRVGDALRAVDGESLRERGIATLSGGERQRVALASVLATQPRLILLDEPTSQLDDAGVRAVEAALAAAAANGAAVVIAEHHVERLTLQPDRTIRLEAGRLASGSVANAPTATGPEQRSAGDETALLTVAGVAAGYGDCLVLDDCSLTVSAGEAVALHGGNGSGKSTLARVIAGLHTPTRGQIRIGERDITGLPAHERYPVVGLVPQDAGRWALRERVDDEVAFGLGHLEANERSTRVAATLDDVDLARFASCHPLDLSVGERERVALAAILAARPSVLVLDEPSRGMDPAGRDELADVLRRRMDEGSAILLITHDPVLAGSVAHRHVRLVKGRLVHGLPRAVAA